MNETFTVYDRYKAWKDRRDSMPLPDGMRYLTPDDIIQEGDEYWIAKNQWHKYHESCFGKPTPPETICYIPRGSIRFT